MIWQLTRAIGLTQMLPSLHEEEEKFLPEETLQKGQATSFQATEDTWSQTVMKHHHSPTTTSLHGFNWQIFIQTRQSHLPSGIWEVDALMTLKNCEHSLTVPPFA